jgi:hypothetical protein
MLKWARKFDTCRWCRETKNKHKGLGLCTACFDRRRAKNPKRKAQLKEQGRKFYDKNKGTDEYKEYNRLRGEKWRESSSAYQVYLQKKYRIERVERFLKTGWKTHIKKLDDTLTVAVNGKHYKTTIKIKEKYVKFSSVDNFELEYFKKRLTEKIKS